MHLSKLRLVGFKSFVEATEFLIQPGLTGVIGPNGCGKSNLVEALRWVMGENSYKSMRASGMDDVIFSGGGDRPARNMAEVGLVLDNAARTAPAQFNDAEIIEVTRRIEREQGSTYRINGRECRARDVQLLFADASTGARSPALVRQGQISEIIAAKPQARRRILEEAAGVAGLHTRRHEAELRLKGAEDNLVRIDDVLAQIDAQGEGLRRQARQAQRYRDLQGEIRRLQALAILIDYEVALRDAAEAQAALEADAARVVDATRQQGEAARHQAIAAYALPALREAETAAGTALQRLVVARETLDGEERRAQGRLAEIGRRLAEMTGDLARDRAALEDAAGVLARLDAEEADLASTEDGSETELDLREALAEAELLRGEAEAELSEAQVRRAEAEARRTSLAERVREEAARLARLDRERHAGEAARHALLTDLEAGGRFGSLRRTIGGGNGGARPRRRRGWHGARPRTQLRATRNSPRADRWRRPSARRSGWRRRSAPSTSFSTQAAQGRGQPSPRRSPSPGASRRHSARRLATISTPRPTLPRRLTGPRPATRDDPALPGAADPLLRHVEAPAALRRRLAQIGVVTRAEGAALRGPVATGAAPGLARGRHLALGWVRPGGGGADPGRSPAC